MEHVAKVAAAGIVGDKLMAARHAKLAVANQKKIENEKNLIQQLAIKIFAIEHMFANNKDDESKKWFEESFPGEYPDGAIIVFLYQYRNSFEENPFMEETKGNKFRLIKLYQYYQNKFYDMLKKSGVPRMKSITVKQVKVAFDKNLKKTETYKYAEKRMKRIVDDFDKS